MPFETVKKIGRPGKPGKFNPLSMKDSGYRVFRVKVNLIATYSAGIQLAGLSNGVFWIRDQDGVFPTDRSFPFGTIFIQYNRIAVSGIVASSSEESYANITERVTAPGGGLPTANRSYLNVESEHIIPPYTCQDNEVVSLEAYPPVLNLKYEDTNTWNYFIEPNFSKTGATGAICSGGSQIDAYVYVKSSYLDNVYEGLSIAGSHTVKEL